MSYSAHRPRSRLAAMFPPSPAPVGMLWETNPVSYAAANKMVVAGVDLTARYLPRMVVYNRANKKTSSVLRSQYVGGNTVVTTIDGIFTPGLLSLGYVPLGVTLTNLLTGGTPLSGGDYYNKVNGLDGSAFDVTGSTSTASDLWASSQSGTGVSGFAWLGYQLATAKRIRWANILQANGVFSCNQIASVLLQYADASGGPWTTLDGAMPLNVVGGYDLIIAPAPDAAHTCWRVLANANPSSGYWGIFQLQMGE